MTCSSSRLCSMRASKSVHEQNSSAPSPRTEPERAKRRAGGGRGTWWLDQAPRSASSVESCGAVSPVSALRQWPGTQTGQACVVRCWNRTTHAQATPAYMTVAPTCQEAHTGQAKRTSQKEWAWQPRTGRHTAGLHACLRMADAMTSLSSDGTRRAPACQAEATGAVGAPSARGCHRATRSQRICRRQRANTAHAQAQRGVKRAGKRPGT